VKNVKDKTNIPNRRTAGKGKKPARPLVLIVFDFPEHITKSGQTRKEKAEAPWDKVTGVRQTIDRLHNLQDRLPFELEVQFYAHGDSK
jgi:hypothetical protein